MKMTQLPATEYKTEFVDLPDEFFDDFENDDFFDEMVNIVVEYEGASKDEQTDSTIESNDDHNLKIDVHYEQLVHDVDELTKSIDCYKRKHRNTKLVNKSKKCKELSSYSPVQSKSPTVYVLKRAVERLKSFNDSIDETTDETDDRSEIFGTSNNGSKIGRISDVNTVELTKLEQIHSANNCNDTCVSPSRFGYQPNIQKIVNDIINGFKVMVIMRGPPGCGKSHLARDIIDMTTKDDYSHHIFSAADFFNNHGRFNFNPVNIAESHQWNQTQVNLYATYGWSPIIVDNTNIKKWEMIDYLKIAVQFGYLIAIAQPNTPWSKSVDELVTKNIHDVPRKTIQRMLLNYEPTTIDELMKSNGLKYTMLMPQYRLLPDLSRGYSSARLSNK